MNKEYYQSMFGSTKGKVYRVVNDLATATSTVTEQFIKDAGTDLVSIVVVNLENMCVVYSDLLDSVSSTYFEEIVDLTPEIIEPVVEEVPPVETPPEETP
jgi:hypothetical protein